MEEDLSMCIRFVVYVQDVSNSHELEHMKRFHSFFSVSVVAFMAHFHQVTRSSTVQ